MTNPFQVSRRQVVKGIGGIAAIGTLGVRPSSAASAGAINRGGTITLSVPGPVAELDPHKVVSHESYPATFHMFSALTRIGRDFSAEPELAKEWWTEDGGLTWTFKLYENASFHSGRPVVAEDVKFSLERVLDERESPRGYSTIGPIQDVIAADPHTVVIKLSKPYLDLPVDLGGIYPRVVDRDTVDRIREAPNGTGPFKLVKWEPEGVTTLEAHRGYHMMGEDGQPLPYLDRLRIVPIKEPTSEFAALQAGDIDVMLQLPFDLIDAAEADSRVAVGGAASGYHSLCLHQNPEFRLPHDNSELFLDKRVRHALAFALDRSAALAVAIGGHGEIGNDQPVPPNHFYGNPELAPPQQDIEKAKELLAQAGVAPGTRLILQTTTGRPGLMECALAVRDMAATAGLEIAVDAVDISRYWTDIEYRAPMYITTWGARATINAMIKPFYVTGGSNNTVGYSDPELDEVLNKAEVEADLETRKGLYHRAEEMIADAAVTIIPYFTSYYIAHLKGITGVNAHPMTYMWLDRAFRGA